MSEVKKVGEIPAEKHWAFFVEGNVRTDDGWDGYYDVPVIEYHLVPEKDLEATAFAMSLQGKTFKVVEVIPHKVERKIAII